MEEIEKHFVLALQRMGVDHNRPLHVSVGAAVMLDSRTWLDEDRGQGKLKQARNL